MTQRFPGWRGQSWPCATAHRGTLRSSLRWSHSTALGCEPLARRRVLSGPHNTIAGAARLGHSSRCSHGYRPHSAHRPRSLRHSAPRPLARRQSTCAAHRPDFHDLGTHRQACDHRESTPHVQALVCRRRYSAQFQDLAHSLEQLGLLHHCFQLCHEPSHHRAGVGKFVAVPEKRARPSRRGRL